MELPRIHLTITSCYKLFPTTLILQNSHTPHRGTVIVAADLNAGLGAAGVDNLAVADIDRHMVDSSRTVAIEHQIAGL